LPCISNLHPWRHLAITVIPVFRDRPSRHGQCFWAKDDFASLNRAVRIAATCRVLRLLSPSGTEAMKSRRKGIRKVTVAGSAGGLAASWAMNEFQAGWSAGRGALCRCRRVGVPALGLASRSPLETTPQDDLFRLGSHFVYGTTTELVRRGVRNYL